MSRKHVSELQISSEGYFKQLHYIRSTENPTTKNIFHFVFQFKFQYKLCLKFKIIWHFEVTQINFGKQIK